MVVKGMSKPTRKRIKIETINGYPIKSYVTSDSQADEVMKILDGMMNEK
jgi:hypothetical protein